MTIQYKLKVFGGRQAIQRAINAAMLEEVSKISFGNVKRLERELKQTFRVYLIREEEYASLKGQGFRSLKGHFGISNTDDVDNIVIWISNFLEALPGRTMMKKREIRTGIRIRFKYNKAFVDQALALGDGVQVTEKGDKLPWLYWLLFEGGRTIIQDYGIVFKPGIGRSRQAVMYPSVKKRWKVPTVYEGVFADNWITRAIDKMKPEIDRMIEEYFRNIR